MRSLVTLASVVALTMPLFAVPQVSMAQSYRDYGGGDICQEEKHQSGNSGMVVGALVGAVVGNQIAGRHHKTAGTLIGAGAGAMVGRQVGKSRVNCKDYPDRYARGGDDCRWIEEEDRRGRRHDFEVCRDRDGEWRPSGRR